MNTCDHKNSFYHTWQILCSLKCLVQQNATLSLIAVLAGFAYYASSVNGGSWRITTVADGLLVIVVGLLLFGAYAAHALLTAEVLAGKTFFASVFDAARLHAVIMTVGGAAVLWYILSNMSFESLGIGTMPILAVIPSIIITIMLLCGGLVLVIFGLSFYLRARQQVKQCLISA